MNEDTLQLHWWSIDPRWSNIKQVKRDWCGVTICCASPDERNTIDWWLRTNTKVEERYRTRTSMAWHNHDVVGSYHLPSFCVYLQRKDARIQLEALLRRFPKRTIECVIPDNVRDKNIMAHLRRVQSKSVIKAEHGTIVSMAPCRDATAAAVLVRLIGSD